MRKLAMITTLFATALLLSGCFALQEPEAASGTAVAPTLAPEPTPLPEQLPIDAITDGADDEPAAPQTDDPPADYPVEAPPPEAPPAEYPAGEAPAAPEATALPADYPAPGDNAAAAGSRTYVLDPARSEARFTIEEVLRNVDTTVVGVTSNLAGELALDLANPAGAQIGAIVINARDFVTDNEFRNRAIANEILRSNEFEFITFTPTAIEGLPGTAVPGESYTVQVSGDLTITDQTRPVTFETEITPLSADELQGLARAEILYADFGLEIPFVRVVQAVEDSLLLELAFTAVAQ